MTEKLETDVIVDGVVIGLPQNLYDKVTYVPGHAEGNAGHEDCEQGVIVGYSGRTTTHNPTIRVLYCKSRTVQHTDPSDLVWG